MDVQIEEGEAVSCEECCKAEGQRTGEVEEVQGRRLRSIGLPALFRRMRRVLMDARGGWAWAAEDAGVQ